MTYEQAIYETLVLLKRSLDRWEHFVEMEYPQPLIEAEENLMDRLTTRWLRLLLGLEKP